ncbi:hypothetical protein SOVF_109850 isoform B, partial [Spinacia oleracea]
KFIQEKVCVVPGDITCKDLGIKESKLKEELWRDVDIIVNLAATTNFDERYDVSLYLNTFGAKYVLEFAKKCAHLEVLVQVSTAYVSGETPGLIKEGPYFMGDSLNGRPGLDIEVEKKLIDEKLDELKSKKTTAETTKISMRNMGLERVRVIPSPTAPSHATSGEPSLWLGWAWPQNLYSVILIMAL